LGIPAAAGRLAGVRLGRAIVKLTAQSEVGALQRVLLKHARHAYRHQDAARSEWEILRFTHEPDVALAQQEYDRFVALLQASGVEPTFIENTTDTLDSIYVRDASILTDRGAILCRMGKPERCGEPAAQDAAFRRLGIPVLGAISPPGTLEGGDVVWLDERTIAVGRGYRTNDDGIRQLGQLLGDLVDELIVVPLPHWRGPADVFHLMSIVSPIDRDLAVVYSPLMPVSFRERLLERGIALVEVPDDEFGTMGANILAIAPRRGLALRGSPVTRRRLEAAGATLLEYDGANISAAGGGGPTCLTRPLARIRS
jgi:N-dimethylarginine dimethylaminohydrolase